MPLQKGIHVWAAYRSVHDEVNMECENCHTHKIDSPNHLLRFNRLAFPRTQQAVMAVLYRIDSHLSRLMEMVIIT